MRNDLETDTECKTNYDASPPSAVEANGEAAGMATGGHDGYCGLVHHSGAYLEPCGCGTVNVPSNWPEKKSTVCGRLKT